MLRAGLFIDVQNLYGITKALNADRIDYRAIKAYFDERYTLCKCVAFSCYDAENDKQLAFFSVISSFGYRVVCKPIKRLWNGQIKANTDMEMAMEILRTAAHLDVVILVTGDSDFVSVVNELSMTGKRVVLLYSLKTAAVELLRCCDEKLRIEEVMPDAVIYRKPEVSTNTTAPTTHTPEAA